MQQIKCYASFVLLLLTHPRQMFQLVCTWVTLLVTLYVVSFVAGIPFRWVNSFSLVVYLMTLASVLVGYVFGRQNR